MYCTVPLYYSQRGIFAHDNQPKMLLTLDPDEENKVVVEDCEYCSQYFYTTEYLKWHKKDTTTFYGICGDVRQMTVLSLNIV